jgi:hypothetical protein
LTLTTPAPAVAVRRTRPVLYGAIAAASVLTSPLTAVWFGMLGILVVLVAAVIGACSRSGPRQDRAVVAVCCGLALMAGLALFLGLALFTA